MNKIKAFLPKILLFIFNLSWISFLSFVVITANITILYYLNDVFLIIIYMLLSLAILFTFATILFSTQKLKSFYMSLALFITFFMINRYVPQIKLAFDESRCIDNFSSCPEHIKKEYQGKI